MSKDNEGPLVMLVLMRAVTLMKGQHMLAMFIALILGLMTEADTDSVFVCEVVVSLDNGAVYNYPDDADIHWDAGTPMLLSRTITTDEDGIMHDVVRVMPLDFEMLEVIKNASSGHVIEGEQYTKFTRYSVGESLRHATATILFQYGLGDPIDGDSIAIVSHMNVGRHGWTAVVHQFPTE